MKNKEFPVNAKKGFLTMLAILWLPLCGCFQALRGVALVNVPDQGETITTKYRYYCIYKSDYNGWLRGEPTAIYKEAVKNYGADFANAHYKVFKEHSFFSAKCKRTHVQCFCR